MNCGLFDQGQTVYVKLEWPTLDILTMSVVQEYPYPPYITPISLNCHQPPIYVRGKVLDKKLQRDLGIVQYYCIEFEDLLFVSRSTFNLLVPLCPKHQNTNNSFGPFILIVEVPGNTTSYDTGLQEEPIEEKNKLKI